MLGKSCISSKLLTAISAIKSVIKKKEKKCKQYILKWDAVGSILKQTKRKHQLTIKTCVDKKSPVMRPNLQPKIYKSPVIA